MPIPTIAGQYRRVRYSDDGCDIYQCLWCLKTVEIRDNPEYGWNFCPCCGKSWFTKKQCRPNTVPRWAWDRYGPDDHHHPPYWPASKKATSEWYFETRHRWSPDDEWSEWHYEWSSDYEKLGEWNWAKSVLARLRGSHTPTWEGGSESEFRVTLRKKT